ncbi:uncharacterized protein E0L32_012324 [Thyridium curvatum]|uniref:Uncharacterized protein n=1 Tax=Thyridium curvatum TaxID=1093900 RepID=A0A507BE44_9PEZI|nr:uncharacterized protein E0L32_012324 [Thyridium curvatum]TPX17014.1 hypothetical protein E0L32_012324 [Thyridium curvatum]
MHLPASQAVFPGSIAFLPSNSSDPGHGHDSDDDLASNWSSLIGIVTAIVGNILIALALNVQRYAHIRLHRQRAQARERARQALKHAGGGGQYGTVAESGNRGDHQNGDDNHAASAEDETEPLANSFQSGDSRWTDRSGDDDDDDDDGDGRPKVSGTYLRSPYWWLGQILITVGEMGNFLAYGFAPASIVSPLGVVALISNCIIAPMFFKEPFRKRDFWGVVIAIGGAVTVVLSAKQQETKLEPHDIWDAITTMEFEIYLGISCSLIALLMWASPRYGRRTILIDLGLVGLFGESGRSSLNSDYVLCVLTDNLGGYTVLATKGVSSMLSSTLFRAFTTPVTYVLLFILLATAVMQVRYVNKALQRFDSTQVIPIQFVMFTLSVIIGSAILYRDFERTTAEQAVKFVGGCLLTFFGVFLITSGRPRHDEDEDQLSDAEGIEETIGLFEQDPASPQAPRRASDHHEQSRSRRSSYKDAVNKPLAALSGMGVPSPRNSITVPARSSGHIEGPDSPSLIDVDNPWRDTQGTPPSHPGPGQHAFSTESVATLSGLSSAAVSDGFSLPATPSQQVNIPTFPHILGPNEAPVTPRAPASSARPQSHHHHQNLFSPSPFSSTVSAVVADKLLGPGDIPTARRASTRRSRPSIRSSLFVSQDELDNEDSLFPPAETDELLRREDPSENGGGGDVETERGFRGRARSLSNTLSGLLGVKKRKGSAAADNTDDEGFLDGRRRSEALASTETL